MAQSTQKVAVITGASGGIGSVIARLFAQNGFRVVLVQRKRPDGLLAEIREAGGDAEAYSLDFASADLETEIAGFWESFDARYDRLDVLIHCAGECPRTAYDDTKEEEVNHIIAVNFVAQLLMTIGARLRMWKTAIDPVILVITSLAGHVGGAACSVAYTAAKAALHAAVTQQGARNGFAPADIIREDGAAPPYIRTHTLCPGPVATPMLDNMSEQDKAKLLANTITKDFATPEGVAKSALAVVTLFDKSTTGQILHLNGGASLR